MTKFAIALAAVIMAAMSFEAAPASAGVRIGFGFPLGHFQATPSHRRSYDRGHRRSRAASSHYRRKQVAASASSARHAKAARMRHIQMAQRQRAMARANARAEARASAAKSAARTSVAKAKTTDKSEDKDSASIETTAEPKPLAPAPIAPPSGPVATEVEPAMVQTTATMSTQTPAAAEPAAAKAKAAPAGDCKKFVPAVGLTISVPCN